MGDTSLINRLRRAYRRRESTLVAVYLCGIVLLVGSFGVDKGRIAILGGVEGIFAYWDDRWTRRLEYGEWLIANGRFAEAAGYLSSLDRKFPAWHVKHARELDRERLLRALGSSYVEIGKKKRALDTYRRLVEFDPRNFENHYNLAMVCVRLHKLEEAIQHFEQVLAIYPTHLPSIRGYMSLLFDKGDFGSVVSVYEKYLDAIEFQNLKVEFGEQVVGIDVPVDGQFHDLEVRVFKPPGWLGELVIRTEKFSIEIKQVLLEAPLVVGKAKTAPTQIWPGETLWRVEEMAPVRPGLYRALGSGAVLHLGLPSHPQGVGKAILRLRLFKAFDTESWGMVEKSYRNLLQNDRLETARSRMLLG